MTHDASPICVWGDNKAFGACQVQFTHHSTEYLSLKKTTTKKPMLLNHVRPNPEDQKHNSYTMVLKD